MEFSVVMSRFSKTFLDLFFRIFPRINLYRNKQFVYNIEK